ncbi:MAG: TetR/AcrR family transcriptional regulator [Clostridia bacterium]|nr:TetR/AcrR family transcriptional regulator [Clostridia bacterium]
MPVRVFGDAQREELRRKMLKAGIPLLREYGMKHMSVEKITEAAGIGKSTFYHFFPSKEKYVCEVIEDVRSRFREVLEHILSGREQMTVGEAKEMFRMIIFSEESAYQYLTPEDIVGIREKVPEAVTPDLAHETALLSTIFAKIEHVRPDPDYDVIANLLKTMALAAQSRDELHDSAYERTQDALFTLMFSLIFDEET